MDRGNEAFDEWFLVFNTDTATLFISYSFLRATFKYETGKVNIVYVKYLHC
jgi:hypothetical protein